MSRLRNCARHKMSFRFFQNWDPAANLFSVITGQYHTWKHRPGRPLKRWLDQICDYSQRPQPMCGETLSDAVIVERRNGPRRLRANDDWPVPLGLPGQHNKKTDILSDFQFKELCYRKFKGLELSVSVTDCCLVRSFVIVGRGPAYSGPQR